MFRGDQWALLAFLGIATGGCAVLGPWRGLGAFASASSSLQAWLTVPASGRVVDASFVRASVGFAQVALSSSASASEIQPVTVLCREEVDSSYEAALTAALESVPVGESADSYSILSMGRTYARLVVLAETRAPLLLQADGPVRTLQGEAEEDE